MPICSGLCLLLIFLGGEKVLAEDFLVAGSRLNDQLFLELLFQFLIVGGMFYTKCYAF